MICVSTFGKNIESLKSKVREARRFRPGFVELRLDYIVNLDSKKIDGLSRFLLGNEILTIRSGTEGGHLGLSESKRIELIRYAISRVKPAYFDIEIQTLQRYYEFFQKDLSRAGTKLIASYHDLLGRKNTKDLWRILQSAPLKANSLYAIKIVTMANTIEDNLKPITLYSNFKKARHISKKTRLVSFCTGDLGIPSRLVCLYLGSPYSYAALPGEAVAPGQIDIKTMRSILGAKRS